MPEDAATFIYDASIWVLPILIAITLHEAGHAYAAWLCGDTTAYDQGRVSLNPIRHIDPYGTILLPAMLYFSGIGFVIGWARPVPVDLSQCRNPRRDNFLISFAGPAMNPLLAFVFLLVAHLGALMPGGMGLWLEKMLWTGAVMNAILFVFNLLPLMPLDGGHVLSSLLPPSLAAPFRHYNGDGFAILFTLMVLVPTVTGSVGHEIDPLRFLVVEPAVWIVGVLEILTGHWG